MSGCATLHGQALEPLLLYFVQATIYFVLSYIIPLPSFPKISTLATFGQPDLHARSARPIMPVARPSHADIDLHSTWSKALAAYGKVDLSLAPQYQVHSHYSSVCLNANRGRFDGSEGFAIFSFFAQVCIKLCVKLSSFALDFSSLQQLPPCHTSYSTSYQATCFFISVN